MYEPLYLPPRNKVSPAPANGQFPEATSYSEKNQLNKEGSQQYPTASSEQESDFGDLDVPWLPFDRNEEEEIQEDLDIPMPWESKEADNSNNKELDRSVGDGSGDAHRPQSASSWLPGWMSGERGDAKMAAASKKTVSNQTQLRVHDSSSAFVDGRHPRTSTRDRPPLLPPGECADGQSPPQQRPSLTRRAVRVLGPTEGAGQKGTGGPRLAALELRLPRGIPPPSPDPVR
mmetsp:Transcript_3359/g.7951  ORF Transcript_3359/g.7951 Transcript_3359/m.7951 type:complete len:231 (-) Transcript_3359:1378-2070(-)